MKKNVLQFIGSFHQGGSERQAVQLTRLLCEDDRHKVFVAALNAEGVLRREVEEIGFTEIPEFKLTSFYDLNFFRQLRRCVRYLKKNKIEIIHTHDFYTNIFGMAAAKLAGVPVKIASKRETGGMRGKLQKVLEKQAFRMADAIVVNSRGSRKLFERGRHRAGKIECHLQRAGFEQAEAGNHRPAADLRKAGFADRRKYKIYNAGREPAAPG